MFVSTGFGSDKFHDYDRINSDNLEKLDTIIAVAFSISYTIDLRIQCFISRNNSFLCLNSTVRSVQ